MLSLWEYGNRDVSKLEARQSSDKEMFQEQNLRQILPTHRPSGHKYTTAPDLSHSLVLSSLDGRTFLPTFCLPEPFCPSAAGNGWQSGQT